MTDGLEAAIAGAGDAAAARDDVVARVRSHAGQIARELAVLQGGDYGQESFDTEAGTWTLKHEAGEVQYLRHKPRSGGEVYVVSTKQPPEPAALASAMADYDAFVAAFNDHVASFDGLLDGVPETFPEVASTADLAAERDRIVARIRDVCDAMAGQLYRHDGEYGTFTARVSGTRWELKWEGEAASYLRVGGEGGTYLLSQYGQPPAPEVRRHAPDVAAFVGAFNDHVADLEADLESVSLAGGTD